VKIFGPLIKLFPISTNNLKRKMIRLISIKNYQKCIFKMLSLKKIKFFNVLFSHQLFKNSFDWAILILRVIPSFYMFYYHGLKKISSTASWEWLGKAAMSVIGIDFGFIFFGFLAALSEGILVWLVFFGIFTRFSSLFVILTMFFASAYHLADGESAESALIYLTIYLVIFILGPGKYSFDEKFLSIKQLETEN